MILQESFSNQLLRVERIFRINLYQRIALTTLSYSLGFVTAFLIAEKSGLFFEFNLFTCSLFVVFSLICSIFYIQKIKKSLMEEIIALDTRFHLKEKLGTAYEYYLNKRQTLFLEPLLEEAKNILKGMKKRQIIPSPVSWFHGSIPVFIVAIILLMWIDFPKQALNQTGFIEMNDKTNGLKINKEIIRGFQESLQEPQKTEKRASNHVDKIAENLLEKVEKRETLTRTIHEMTQRNIDERNRTAQLLRTKLKTYTSENVPQLSSFSNENIGLDSLRQLEKQLARDFDNRIPENISRDMSSLDRNFKLQQFLNRLKQELESSPSTKEQNSKENEEEPTFEGSLTDEEERSNDVPSSGEKQKAERLKRLRAIMGIQSFQKGNSSDKMGDEEGDLGDNYSYRVGKNKSSGKTNPTKELRSSKGEIHRDKGISQQGEIYRVPLRSTPSIGDFNEKEKKILRTYERVVEEVLKKEEIPLNYREYIKNYFLSIGLRKEE